MADNISGRFDVRDPRDDLDMDIWLLLQAELDLMQVQRFFQRHNLKNFTPDALTSVLTTLQNNRHELADHQRAKTYRLGTRRGWLEMSVQKKKTEQEAAAKAMKEAQKRKEEQEAAAKALEEAQNVVQNALKRLRSVGDETPEKQKPAQVCPGAPIKSPSLMTSAKVCCCHYPPADCDSDEETQDPEDNDSEAEELCYLTTRALAGTRLTRRLAEASSAAAVHVVASDDESQAVAAAVPDDPVEDIEDEDEEELLKSPFTRVASKKE